MPASKIARPICAAWLALVTASAQNSAPPQAPATDENVIRINVNLVQLDAVVTDSHDRPVTDLKASDFQLLQDGKAQKITNFSFISVRPNDVPTAPAPVAQTKGSPPPPPVMLKPNQARRLIALVVDDLALAFDSTARVRQALKKFVDTEMQPGDLVAIVRTGAGMGALQQFTTDKRVLYAAIDHVRFNSMGRVGVSSFDPLGSDEHTAVDAEREGILAAGSLGAIRFVINGLRELPGRKAVVLFSENLKLFSMGGENDRALEAARRLEDAANRAGVVIYSIDPRGLQSYSLTAADNTGKMSPRQIARVPQMRAAQVFHSQDGMAMLAHDTGGLFFHDSNDIAGQLRKAVADTDGYYLLGYHPDASTFDPKTGLPKFHKVEVKLTRAGLHVRSRSGFFGKSDSYAQHKPVGMQAELAEALQSPFGANQVHVRLTTLFAQSPAAGSFVNAMLHIDARDLKFTDQPDGWHKAAIDVEAVTFGDNGQAVDSSGKTYTLQLKDDAYQNALKNGLVYTMQHPIKKPGAYQMRVALRDADSEQMGSASEFIEIPDVSKGKLLLSSLILRQYQPPPDAGRPQAADAHDSQSAGTPAMRVFGPGQDILYGYQILNPQVDSNQKPQLESFSRVFRDGQEIFTGKPQPIDLSTQTDIKKMVSGGVLKLGDKMRPGDYVLQVVVTDKIAKTTATQWSDFEVKDAAAAQRP